MTMVIEFDVTFRIEGHAPRVSARSVTVGVHAIKFDNVLTLVE
jgi:hypothetical protein